MHAQFSTGFETSSSGSPAYVVGQTFIGAQDTQAPSGNVWKTLFGSQYLMTLSTSQPATGSRNILINDTASTSAYGAYVDLAGTSRLDLTQPFTLSFAFKIDGVSAGTGSQVQVYLGASSTNLAASKYWAILMYDNGALKLYVSNPTGNGATPVPLGSYATYSPSGANYVRASITVNPMLKKYSRVTLSGNGVTNDLTATVQAVNGGVIPWLPAVNPTVNPSANLVFVTGTDDTLMARFDDILLANAGLWYEGYAPGVILPDQGTLQMTASFSRPITQFGNSYDFLFKLLPANNLSTGKNLMGMYVPATVGGTGLYGMTRNANGSTYASDSTFSPGVGTPTRLAMSWDGGGVKLYVNGAQVATTSSSIGDLAPLPALFRVAKLDPFNISEVKVSDVALGASALDGNAATPMSADANTTLLAGSNLETTQYFHTARQAALGYHSMTPIWRIEDQSLVEGTTPSYPLIGINHSGTIQTYSVSIVATDYLGASVFNQTWNFEIPADNAYRVFSPSLTGLGNRGYYRLHTTITSPSSPVTIYDSALAVFPPDEATVADGPWATFLGHHYAIEDHSPVVLNRLGIKTSRVFGDLGGFYWYSVQPNQGIGTNGFTWKRTDLLVQKAKCAGIDLLGLLGNPPLWAAQDPGEAYKSLYPEFSRMSGRWKPRDMAEWGNYVFQVVSRYKNDVKNWEIWNEVDWHPSAPYYSFSGSTMEYLAFLQTAYTQAKLADPTCNVLMSGFSLVSSADVNMPTDLLDAGAASNFDTFASHGYENTRIDSLNTALYDKKGSAAPHWMTEQMWYSVGYERDRLFLTLELFMRYLDKGVDRFYQFGFEGFCFDGSTFSPTIDTYIHGVFQSQVRKAETYEGKYTFPGSDGFALRHYFTRTDNKTLSILGAELIRNNVTVTGTVLSATDSFGKPITQTTAGGNTVVDITDTAYIVSDSPLTITNVELIEGAPLLLNGGFEDISGDVQVGGLDSCTPLNWTLRTTSYDPAGKINLTTSSHSGFYGLTLFSSGAGRVYAFQDVRITAPGNYRATARFRRVNAGETTLVPYLMFFNRDANTFPTMTYPNVVAGGDYTLVTFDLTFSAPQIQSGALIAGIYSGSGTLLLDDVTFQRIAD